MNFYFSGIEGPKELELLGGAGPVLVDPFQFGKLDLYRETLASMGFAFDSGAYRKFKAGDKMDKWDIDQYDVFLRRNYDAPGFRGWAASLDVIGGLDQSWRNFCMMTKYHKTDDVLNLVPIWHYKEPEDHLYGIMECSDEVGIGGLVPYLHSHADPKLKAECRSWLIKICQAEPHRFRLFGCCDIRTLNVVKPDILSADSSIWLRGRRYGALIWHDEENDCLKQFTRAQQRIIIGNGGSYDYIDEAVEMTGDELCARNAQNIQAWASS